MTLAGRVAGADPTTVHVSLVTADKVIRESGLTGAFDLVLEDGERVRVDITPHTRVDGDEIEEARTTGRWDRLAEHPDARWVESHAPGPHVRATLVRSVLRPGARVVVRGAVVERAASVQPSYREAAFGAPEHVTAAAITAGAVRAASTSPGPKPEARGDSRLLRCFGAFLAVAAIYVFVRRVLFWPPELVDPRVLPVRASLGAACAIHIALGCLLVCQRPGGVARLLPRFVRADNTLFGSTFFAGFIIFGAVGALAFGVAQELALGEIERTRDLAVRGSKGGQLLDGSWIPATFQWLVVACAILGLYLRERSEAKLATLFGHRGAGWTVRRGELREGTLKIHRFVDGSGRSATHHWTASIQEPLTVTSGDDTIAVNPEGLAWGIDTVAPTASPEARATTWAVGTGAAVAIAGRFGDATTLRAHGPESLVLVASTATADVVASLARGLRLRSALLGIAIAGAILAAVIASVR